MRYHITVCLMTLLVFALAGEVRAAEKRYSLEAETGIGYDSNAFLAPTDSYFDPLSNQFVIPDRKSGFFTTLLVKGDYASAGERLRLLTSLDFDGQFYPRKELNDSDTYKTELNAGLEFLLGGRDRRRNTLYIGPSIAYKREIYFDRDTGLEKATALTQQELGERFTYFRYGLEAKLRVRTLPVQLDLKGEIAKYDYEEVPVLDSLDYNLYLAGMNVQFDIFKDTWLDVNADYFIRDFEDRRSRDLAGDLVAGTDRKYIYYGAGVSIGRRLRPNWTVYLDYDYLKRVDDFAGYRDYGRNRFRTRVLYRDRDGRKLRFELAYWHRDYPRAFVFDQPTPETNFVPRKADYKTWEAGMRDEFPLSRLWKVWAEYDFINQSSADPRYDYRRHQISFGVGAEI